MILFKDWTLSKIGNQPLANQYDNLTRRLEVTGDLPEGWEWAMLVEVKEAGAMNIIPLTPMEGGVGHTLTDDQLSIGDKNYSMQLRGIRGEEVRHTNVIQVFVAPSISGTGHWPSVPSEFREVEQRILELNAHPPVPGENGYWLIWNPDADQYEGSTFPLPGGSAASVSGETLIL